MFSTISSGMSATLHMLIPLLQSSYMVMGFGGQLVCADSVPIEELASPKSFLFLSLLDSEMVFDGVHSHKSKLLSKNFRNKTQPSL